MEERPCFGALPRQAFTTAQLLTVFPPDPQRLSRSSRHLACENENGTSLLDRSRLNLGRPPRKRLDRRRFERVVVIFAFDVSADPRHLAIWVTSRGPTIERRSDGRARCQQYGQIRFEQIDLGLDDKDHIRSSEERFRVAMARQL
jgi:hypothetical protein